MRASLLTFSAWAAFASIAVAWGPTTHMYIARCVTESSDAIVTYGAALPDMNAVLLSEPQVNAAIKDLLHDEFDLLPPSFLGIGVATHNSFWGADYYAHLFWHPENPETDTTYSTIKIRQLSADLGISLGNAEDLFEGTIDYLIRIDHGPAMAAMVERAAEAGLSAEQVLVDTYTAPLMQRLPSLTQEEAEGYIRYAAQGFQFITRLFGQQLAQDDETVTEAVPPLLARYLGIDEETAETYFNYAVALCQDDYNAELMRICANIRTRIDSGPAFQMPLGTSAAIITALLALASGARRLRRQRD